MSMTISIDDELKREFSEVCAEMGLSASAAFTVFAKAVVREKAIPFEVAAESSHERQDRIYEEQLASLAWDAFEDSRLGNAYTLDDVLAARPDARMAA